MSMMARMGEADIRLLGLEADSLEMSHIGAGINGTHPRTITNPSGRGDLCVADVGAHQANGGFWRSSQHKRVDEGDARRC
jgi:hypothetical protein